jgi:magnesium chelatase family protein
MYFKLRSATVIGLNCEPVDIEIDINKGQTNFQIVGLPDASIREAKERIYSAIKNSGFDYPYNYRLLVNLAPADIPKEGPMYDLPMAVGLVAASQELPLDLSDAIIVGELALDGKVRHVNGLLPLIIHAKHTGVTRIFIPAEDVAEAELVTDGPTIFPINNFRELMAHLLDSELISPHTNNREPAEEKTVDNGFDMSLVRGQTFAKRALEIAAAGGHNIIMSGPPGSGKTLLARTLPTILPPLTTDESLEVTKIYSVAGLIRQHIIRSRPFRSPHHTISGVASIIVSR